MLRIYMYNANEIATHGPHDCVQHGQFRPRETDGAVEVIDFEGTASASCMHVGSPMPL